MPPIRVRLREIVHRHARGDDRPDDAPAAFHLYASFAGQYQVYGFIGAVLLFLLWLYFGSLVLLVGAVVNVAFAEWTGGGE